MKHTLIQLARYGIVGVASNAFGYILYLWITYIGMGPKLSMSILFAIGVLQTYVFNKKWSFRFEGAATPALVRYITVYAVGYVINLLALLFLVDHKGLSHQVVQGFMIIFIAVFLFIAQKFWVFPQLTKNINL